MSPSCAFITKKKTMPKGQKIPEQWRRGNDYRTDRERGRDANGRNPRKRRGKYMCKTNLCPSEGRRGWAKGFCKKCAKQRGHIEPKRKYPMCIAIGCPSRGQGNWCEGHCKKCAIKIGKKRVVKVKNKLKMMAETADAEKKIKKEVKKEPEVLMKKKMNAQMEIKKKPKVMMAKAKGPKPKAKTFPGNSAWLDAIRTTGPDDGSTNTPVSGHPNQEDTKKDTKKDLQEMLQKLKPPSPTEMFQVVSWPQEVFENKEDYFDIQEIEEENGLEWHELSGSSQRFYEKHSARQVCAAMIFMTETGGTLQEFKSLDSPEKNSYCSDCDSGIHEGKMLDSDLAYLECLAGCHGEFLGWLPWRMHSLEKMEAGGQTVHWQRQGFTLSPPSVAEGDIIEPEAGEEHAEGHPNQKDMKKDTKKETKKRLPEGVVVLEDHVIEALRPATPVRH